MGCETGYESEELETDSENDDAFGSVKPVPTVELETEAVLVDTGTPFSLQWDEMSPLQKHVAFFDYDYNGYVTVWETYAGLRALGIGPLSSSAFAVAINGALATPTSGYPTMTININRIEKGMHGSDTGIYDSEGRFVPEQFDAFFERWDENGDDGLDAWELTQRWLVDADLFDFMGIAASGAEFGLLYVLAAEDGSVSRERMLALYEGTLFYILEQEQSWDL